MVDLSQANLAGKTKFEGAIRLMFEDQNYTVLRNKRSKSTSRHLNLSLKNKDAVEEFLNLDSIGDVCRSGIPDQLHLKYESSANPNDLSAEDIAECYFAEIKSRYKDRLTPHQYEWFKLNPDMPVKIIQVAKN